MQQNTINCTHIEGDFRFLHICHAKKLQIFSPRTPFVSPSQISGMMWINFKFLHMTDVEKSEISFNMCTIYGILLHFTLFCFKKLVFFAIHAVFRKIGLLQFTRYLMNEM